LQKEHETVIAAGAGLMMMSESAIGICMDSYISQVGGLSWWRETTRASANHPARPQKERGLSAAGAVKPALPHAHLLKHGGFPTRILG